MLILGEEWSEERQNLHKNKISPQPPNRYRYKYRNMQKSNKKMLKILLPVIIKQNKELSQDKKKVSPYYDDKMTVHNHMI